MNKDGRTADADGLSSLRDEVEVSPSSSPKASIPCAGDTFTIAYPFVRDTYSSYDGDHPTWRPGINYVSVADDHSAPVADEIGQAIFTVVGVFKPGRFPTRVFFTRQFAAPGGRRFGKSRLLIATLDKFRRLTRGYQHPFGVGKPLPSDHHWWRKDEAAREFMQLLSEYASATEARRAETAKTDSVHEGAVPQGDAQPPTGQPS